MITLNIISEGSAEESFVNNVLRGYFARMGIYVYTRRILTGWNTIKNRPAKGGVRKYAGFRNDILRWIESDRGKKGVYYTTLVDLYGFPKDKMSPYNEEIQHIGDPYDKIYALEKAIGEDINYPHFIPYIQLHEFETLLLSDISKLKEVFPDKSRRIDKLQEEIRDLDPEMINEHPEKAPSKRIIKYVPEYEGLKSSVGPLVTEDIGLDLLRKRCPHFNEWVTGLETLADV